MPNPNDNSDNEKYSGYPKRPNFWYSTRMGLAVISCIGFAANYSLRVNLSVGIVCMMNHTALAILDQNSTYQADPECNVTDSSLSSAAQSDGSFIWPKAIQGLLLSAFFYGYICLQIPGGLLSHKFGGRRVIGYSMIVAGGATLFTPIAATFNPMVVFALRILVGLGLSTHYPSSHNVWKSWAPILERSTLIGIAFSGAPLGNIITLVTSGFLCSTFGWESIFYCTGAFALIWALTWLSIVRDLPERQPCISDPEKEYIIQCLATQSDGKPATISQLPWSKVARSLPFYAIMVAHFSGNWSTYLMLTCLPTFMHDVLHFEIKSNALLSSLPYAAYFVMISVGGLVADFLQRHHLLTTTNVRKLMMFLTAAGQGIGFLGAGYCGCGQEYIAVGLLVFSMAFNGLSNSSYTINPADIAPSYAGILFSISNLFATIPGIVAPEVVALLAPHGTRAEWQLVLWITAGIMAFGTIFYTIFAKGEVQEWAKQSELEVDEEHQRLLES